MTFQWGALRRVQVKPATGEHNGMSRERRAAKQLVRQSLLLVGDVR